jgi:hypothetical protein
MRLLRKKAFAIRLNPLIKAYDMAHKEGVEVWEGGDGVHEYHRS